MASVNYATSLRAIVQQ